MIFVDSIRSIRMFDRVMLLIGALGAIGWALLPSPAAGRSGGVSVLAGLLGGIGTERFALVLEALRVRHATPWQVAATQRPAVIDVVVGASLKGPIGAVASGSDQETSDFLAQLDQLLTEAGWNGVNHTDAETEEWARRLIDTFQALGI